MSRRHFDVDGSAVPFDTGQTVGAALVAAGRPAWRSTRQRGRPRGIFCGIGVCYDCLITVDGVPNQRACQVLATEQLDVRTQEATGHEL